MANSFKLFICYKAIRPIVRNMLVGCLVACLMTVFTSINVGHSLQLHDGHFVLIETKAAVRDVFVRRYRRSPSTEAAIRQFHVKSKVASRYSRVTVTSEVRNNARLAQEVSVDLRLPKKAFISNFSMNIDAATYVGVVKEKAEAKAQYKHAVAMGSSAGLVSANVREVQTFSVSVNVAAGETVTFSLDYQELLERKLGVYDHLIYVNPGQIVEDMAVEVEISETTGITKLDVSPPKTRGRNTRTDDFDTEDNVILRRTKTQAFISYRPSVAKQQSFRRNMDLSFSVKYDVTREELGGEILIKDGYFVHFFAPPHLPAIPKNVVFIIDTSGSMRGSKIEQTKTALWTILDDLSDADRFNLITFSSGVHMWAANRMMNVTPDNIDNAKSFVRRINADGGTNIHEALMHGISLLQTITNDRPNSLEEAAMLILLTDGQPTEGVTNLQQIRTDVTYRVNGSYSIFCLGFGVNVDHSFLEKLAVANKGLSRKIYTDADAALQLKNFYDEVATPLLAHVIVEYRGIPAVDTTTTSFNNHFDGSEIMVVGRLNLALEGTHINDLYGYVGASSSDGEVTLVSRGKEIDETFVDGTFDMENLWAYLTIKDLIKNKTFTAGDDQVAVDEINAEIVRLSLKFNFVTPMTSMVVTKPGDDVSDRDGGSIPPPATARRMRLAKMNGRARTPSYLQSSVRTLSSSSLVRSSPNMFSSRTMAPLDVVRRPRVKSKKKLKTRNRGGGSRRRRLRAKSNRRSRNRHSGRRRKHSNNAPVITAANRIQMADAVPRPATRATSAVTTTTPRLQPPTTTTAVTTHTTTSSPVTRATQTPSNPLTLETTCGGNITLHLGRAQNITSPRYPGLYPASTQCVWRVTLSGEFRESGGPSMRLTFPILDLEGESCNRDRILVYQDFDDEASSSSELHELCGYNSGDDDGIRFFDTNENFVIVFQSDDRVQGRGFLANLHAFDVV